MRLSSPGCSKLTKPALMISKCLRAGMLFINSAISALRSLFGSLTSEYGGSVCVSNASKIFADSCAIVMHARCANSSLCGSVALLCMRASRAANMRRLLSSTLPCASNSSNSLSVGMEGRGPSPGLGVTFIRSVTPTASIRKKQSLLMALGVTLRSWSSPIVRTPRPFI